MTPSGKYFRGYLASNDMSTAADIPLYDANGNLIVLAAGERPIITDLSLNNGGTASVITVFQDMDNDAVIDAGEMTFSASLGVNLMLQMNFTGELRGQVVPTTANLGKLKVVASAASANSRVIIIGKIVIG